MDLPVLRDGVLRDGDIDVASNPLPSLSPTGPLLPAIGRVCPFRTYGFERATPNVPHRPTPSNFAVYRPSLEGLWAIANPPTIATTSIACTSKSASAVPTRDPRAEAVLHISAI